jgi:formylglycine-generating enzyme required for sulfatase activity
MGSPETERFRDKDETRHKVKLTRGFWLGKYEVTQRQWTRVMGKNPAGFKNPDNPVEMVNWTDAQEFIGKLNANRLPPNPESRTPNPEPRTLNPLFRLPTEAEWEYACRAGATGVFCHADSLDATQANFNGNSPYGSGKIAEYRQKTTPAGSFKPNAWGLFDMHGNLWEWCADWYGQYPARDGTDPAGITTGSQRVLRGGCWYDVGAACRSAFRGKNKPDWRWTGIGFRLAMEGQ